MRFYQIEPTLENYWRGIILLAKTSPPISLRWRMRCTISAATVAI